MPLRTGALHLRGEAWAINNDDAHTIADKLNTFLAMFHTAETSVGSPGSDADLKAFFDSLQVRQEENRAVVYALVPTGVFRKLIESPSGIPAAVAPASAPSH